MNLNTIHMPTIVLLGDQESGKTSLLENILKAYNIFPRDRINETNAATLRPLCLSIVKSDINYYMIENEDKKELI